MTLHILYIAHTVPIQNPFLSHNWIQVTDIYIYIYYRTALLLRYFISQFDITRCIHIGKKLHVRKSNAKTIYKQKQANKLNNNFLCTVYHSCLWRIVQTIYIIHNLTITMSNMLRWFLDNTPSMVVQWMHGYLVLFVASHYSDISQKRRKDNINKRWENLS